MALNQPYTPGLDRWEQMQKNEFGTNTALSRNNFQSSGVGESYRGDRDAYRDAERILKRQSRTGDPDTARAAALARIGLRDEAQKAGLDISGVQTREGRQEAVMGREQSLMGRAQEAEKRTGLNRQLGDEVMGAAGAKVVPAESDMEDGTIGVSDPVNPSRSWVTSPSQLNASRDFVSRFQAGRRLKDRMADDVAGAASKVQPKMKNWWDTSAYA